MEASQVEAELELFVAQRTGLEALEADLGLKGIDISTDEKSPKVEWVPA